MVTCIAPVVVPACPGAASTTPALACLSAVSAASALTILEIFLESSTGCCWNEGRFGASRWAANAADGGCMSGPCVTDASASRSSETHSSAERVVLSTRPMHACPFSNVHSECGGKARGCVRNELPPVCGCTLSLCGCRRPPGAPRGRSPQRLSPLRNEAKR